MRVAGLDVHKRVVEACVLDETGTVRHRARFPCTREALVAFARAELGPSVRVALEATTNTWGIVRVLQPECAEVVVSNPLRTKAIATAKVKTDRVDAEVLAQLLRCEYLPPVWAPDEATRRLRGLTSRRAALVAERTRVKNRLHAILHQRLLHAPVADLFGRRGRAWLESVDLDNDGRAAVRSELRLLDAVGAEIDELGATLARLAHDQPAVRLLMTLPGIDVAVALTLLAALGDVTRFRDGAHAASYLGLVPSTKQSADRTYHGPITKQGASHARWMLVQAAQHLDRNPGPLGVFFRRLARKKNRNVAVVATARKLVVIAWHMLTKGEPYRYAQPAPTQTKLARLRVAATGQRRRTGPKPGTPRPDLGTRTRAVPALDHILQDEGLPPTSPPPAGERRLLEHPEVAAHLQTIRKGKRKIRRSNKEESPTEGS